MINYVLSLMYLNKSFRTFYLFSIENVQKYISRDYCDVHRLRINISFHQYYTKYVIVDISFNFFKFYFFFRFVRCRKISNEKEIACIPKSISYFSYFVHDIRFRFKKKRDTLKNILKDLFGRIDYSNGW